MGDFFFRKDDDDDLDVEPLQKDEDKSGRQKSKGGHGEDWTLLKQSQREVRQKVEATAAFRKTTTWTTDTEGGRERKRGGGDPPPAPLPRHGFKSPAQHWVQLS